MKAIIHQPDCATHPQNSAGLVSECNCIPQIVEIDDQEAKRRIFKLIGKKEKK
jgi:hypothetical protein